MGTLLKHLMESLDDSSRKILFTEISDLVKQKTSLDFGFTINDIIKEVKPAEVKTPEQIEEERKINAFSSSLKEYADGNSLKDFSIQAKI
ncbi:MAG: hypothetical protein ACYCZO_12095 [Daejeonella sp.]